MLLKELRTTINQKCTGFCKQMVKFVEWSQSRRTVTTLVNGSQYQSKRSLTLLFWPPFPNSLITKFRSTFSKEVGYWSFISSVSVFASKLRRRRIMWTNNAQCECNITKIWYLYWVPFKTSFFVCWYAIHVFDINIKNLKILSEQDTLTEL